MTKFLLTSTLIMTLFTTTLHAQDIKIHTLAGYIFDDSFDSRFDATNYYNGKIEGAFQWGGGIEAMVNDDYGVELSYVRQKTHVPLNYYYYGRQFQRFTAGINYILIGTNRYFELNSDKIKPFVGAQLGMVAVHWTNPYSISPDTHANGNGDFVKFAWSAKAGTEVWFTEAVGLKLQAQLLSAVQSVGGAFYIGTGGSGAGLSANSSIFQFGLGGGLTFKLSKEKKKK